EIHRNRANVLQLDKFVSIPTKGVVHNFGETQWDADFTYLECSFRERAPKSARRFPNARFGHDSSIQQNGAGIRNGCGGNSAGPVNGAACARGRAPRLARISAIE